MSVEKNITFNCSNAGIVDTITVKRVKRVLIRIIEGISKATIVNTIKWLKGVRGSGKWVIE